MRFLTFALLLAAAPASAAGLAVLSGGVTAQATTDDFMSQYTYVGAELRLDLGHDFRYLRIGGEFRFTAAEGVPSAAYSGGPNPNPTDVTLGWGPAIELRLGRWVRLGASILFGVLVNRYTDDCPTCYLNEVAPLIEPTAWLSVDLWHDRWGRGPLLTGEVNVDIIVDHGTDVPRAGGSLLFGYRL